VKPRYSVWFEDYSTGHGGHAWQYEDDHGVVTGWAPTYKRAHRQMVRAVRRARRYRRKLRRIAAK
jgi:hypothetical protein